MLNKLAALWAAGALIASAGPVEFGMAEFQRAIAARGLNAKRFAVKTEVAIDPPESYRVTPLVITGGDLRGLMYGLFEAAEQIERTGRLVKSEGKPALSIRGVLLHLADVQAEWFHNAAQWVTVCRTLSRNRFNRISLAVADVAALAPASDTAGQQNLDALRHATRTAAEYGLDFALTIEPAADADGQSLEAALLRILSACPAIRSVQLRMDAEAAAYGIRALRETGRRMLLEAAADAQNISGAAVSAGIPVRLIAPYPGDTPFARRGQFLFELGPGSIGPNAARSALAALALKLSDAGAGGFEVEMPSAEWDAAAAGRLTPFFQLGRLAYDPTR